MADYATLLRDHVTLSGDCVDRFFWQGYVPKLKSVGQVCRFLRWQRQFPIPSSAAFGKIGDAYVKDVHRFAKDHDVPVVYFKKGESKEEIARPLIDAAGAQGGNGGVVLIGIAQENGLGVAVVASQGPGEGTSPAMEWGRQMAFVNHFYFYLWDPDWGPAFVKTNAYAPYPIWIYLNGHEWAKRQLEKAGIGYQSLDNGSAPTKTPGPCSACATGWGRGRCDHSSGAGSGDCLRRVTKATPGAFRTKVITRGVDPQICRYYRSARMKQYFKEHRALRTETVISNTRSA